MILYANSNSNTGITFFLSRKRSISIGILFLTVCENPEIPLDIGPEIRMGYIRGLLLVGRFVEQGDKLRRRMSPLISDLAIDVSSEYQTLRSSELGSLRQCQGSKQG